MASARGPTAPCRSQGCFVVLYFFWSLFFVSNNFLVVVLCIFRYLFVFLQTNTFLSFLSFPMAYGSLQRSKPPCPFRREDAANLCTEILDFRGFDSSRILILRGGTLMSIRDSPEIWSQRILVGIILVGRLCVRARSVSLARSWLRSRLLLRGCAYIYIYIYIHSYDVYLCVSLSLYITPTLDSKTPPRKFEEPN